MQICCCWFLLVLQAGVVAVIAAAVVDLNLVMPWICPCPYHVLFLFVSLTFILYHQIVYIKFIKHSEIFLFVMQVLTTTSKYFPFFFHCRCHVRNGVPSRIIGQPRAWIVGSAP